MRLFNDVIILITRFYLCPIMHICQKLELTFMGYKELFLHEFEICFESHTLQNLLR